MRWGWLLIGLVACGTIAPPVGGPSVVVGQVPTAPLTVPEFSAVNQEGAPRGRPDLLGHPSVVWYFPAAGTPG